MAARVVARSALARLEDNSAVRHILAAAANELAEVYFQLARLRQLFSIDTATGSDLDLRAAEIQPGSISRRAAGYASGDVVFSRVTTVGTVTIPAGTIVAAEDAEGLIRYRTTVSGSITPGNTLSGAVGVVALDAGVRGNVASDEIRRFVTRVAGVTGVTNGTAFDNGADRESDRDFRARLKAYVRSLARGTVAACEGFARNVRLADGRRVLFARIVESATPAGYAELYIDDGTGSVDEYSSGYLTTPDVVLASAVGGETRVFTTERPVRDDGSFVLSVNAVPLVRNTDYYLNAATGQVDLVVALSASDVVRAEYRYFIGLIQQTQKVIDGDPDDRISYPGVRPVGVIVYVRAPAAIFQSVEAAIAVANGFDVDDVSAECVRVIQSYINTLDIGAHVIGAEIIERAMGVPGMANFRFLALSGSIPPVADGLILPYQVARIAAASITLT